MSDAYFERLEVVAESYAIDFYSKNNDFLQSAKKALSEKGFQVGVLNDRVDFKDLSSDLVIASVTKHQLEELDQNFSVIEKDQRPPLVVCLNELVLDWDDYKNLPLDAFLIDPISEENLIQIANETLLPKNLRWNRRSNRLLVGLDVAASKGDKSFSGKIKNISATGLFSQLEGADFSEGDTVDVSFAIETDLGEIEVNSKARIQWLKKDGENENLVGYGLSFQEMSVRDRFIIVHFMTKKRLDLYNK